MNKETLRMQMLAGIITESQYKAKLNEDEDETDEDEDEESPFDSDDDNDKPIDPRWSILKDLK